MSNDADVGFADALVRLSHMVQQVFGDVSRTLDLTPQQTQLLCRLVERPLSMTDLSKALNLEKSSLTGLVDRVEKRALVARLSDPHDRRSTLVTLTEDGSRLAVTAKSAISDRLDGLAGNIDRGDQTNITAVVAALLVAHGAETGTAWFERPNAPAN